MSDLAVLGLQFETHGAEQANKALTDIAANSGKAERATDALAAGQRRANSATSQLAAMAEQIADAEREMARAADVAAVSTGKLGTAAIKAGKDAQIAANHFDALFDATSRDFAQQYVAQMGTVIHANDRAITNSKVLTQTTLNLSRQFADVGVQAAMGTNALMIAIMQGPQIADAFAQAKSQGVGFKEALSGITKGTLSLVATWGPLLALGGAVVGGFMLWRKHLDDTKKALEETKKATQELSLAQADATNALGQAAEFADRYKVAAGGLTSTLDKLLASQNANYSETMAGIGATDSAGRAAARRAELERLLTVNILRRAAAEAEARAQASKDAAKLADKAAFGSGLITAMGMAGNPEALRMGQQVQAEKFRKLGGEAAEKAAAQEMEYAKALKASADELLRAKLTLPEADANRKQGLSEAEKAAKKVATEAERAREATSDYITSLQQELAAVGQTSNAVRRLAADREIELALKRGDTDSAARIKSLILEIEKTEELAAALEYMAKARKEAIEAANDTGPLKTIPTDVVLEQESKLEELIKEFEEARRKADEIRYSVEDIFASIREQDWVGAFSGLFRALELVKKAFEKGATAADKMAAVAGVGQAVGSAVGGKAGGAISGAASAASTAFMLTGNPLVAAGAAVIGGITGWLSSSKAEKAERNAQALKRAEEELARAREIAAKRADLEIELLEARGQAEAALEARHKATLAALDPSLRALQELIWAEQKLTEERQKAVDVAQTAVDDARARLQEAYDAEASALNNYIDRFRGWSNSLKTFLNGLNRGPAAMLSPEEQYRAARADFDRVSASAAAGNEDAIRDLETVSQAYLDASKAYYASSKAYFEDLARVRAAVTATQSYAEAQVSNGEQQLAALNASVSGILQVNQSVLSVRDALAAYQAAVIALAEAQAANKPAANDNVTPRGTDWTSYIANNGDVAAEYLRNMGSEKGRAYLAQLGIGSAEAFGQWHWNQYGKNEGRTPYATGGIMDRPITLGESGIGGEAGPEGILPLANVGGEMGVRASLPDTSALLAEVRGLREELAGVKRELAAANVQRGAIAKETLKQGEELIDETAKVNKNLRAA